MGEKKEKIMSMAIVAVDCYPLRLSVTTTAKSLEQRFLCPNAPSTIKCSRIYSQLVLGLSQEIAT